MMYCCGYYYLFEYGYLMEMLEGQKTTPPSELGAKLIRQDDRLIDVFRLILNLTRFFFNTTLNSQSN